MGLLAACQSAPPASPLLKNAPEVGVAPDALRTGVRGLIPVVTGIMEDTADRAVAADRDPAARALALQYKTDAVPLMIRALTRPDPVAALLGAWAYALQLKEYFGRDGAAGTGPARTALLEGVNRMEGELVRYAGTLSDGPGLERARGFVERFARDHPLEGLAGRQTVEVQLAELTAGGELGWSASVARAQSDFEDAMARMDALSASMPKQMRWQAERAVVDVLGAQGAADLPGDLAALAALARGAAVRLEGLPTLLGGEREAVLAALRTETRALEAWAGAERRLLQGFVSGERDEALARLSSERVAILAALAAERAAALEGVRDERMAAMQDLERIGQGLVDRLAMRAALLLGALAIAALLLIVAARLSWMRP
jgi:hypothetical protein